MTYLNNDSRANHGEGRRRNDIAAKQTENHR